MALRLRWPARRSRRRKRVDASAEVELFSWSPGRQPWLPGGTYVGTWAARISAVTREEALSVPAVVRGRNLICSVAALPLVLRDEQNRPLKSALLHQLDSATSNVVTIAATIEDLIFEGYSWWQVIKYDGRHYPTKIRHLDSTSVSMQPPPGYPLATLPSGLYPEGVIYVAGAAVDARNIIRFDSPNPPLLTASARAVRRALKLAQAGEMYADDPEARAVWVPAEGADPANDEAIRTMLAEYQRARRNGSEGYIPAAVKRMPIEAMSPADLTLAQLQQRSDLEIANVLGLDPEDLGVNTTSRTYANAVDRRVDQVNQNLGVWMSAITSRLSMDDITQQGQRTVFDLAAYMQADPSTRWSTYQTAVGMGAMTVDEVRAKENLPPMPARPVSRETKPVVPAPQGGAQANAAGPAVVSFSAATDGVCVHFDSTVTGEHFAADLGRRRVAGMLIPYGPVGVNATGRWRFARGSVAWPRSAVSRVKLDREHSRGDLLGAATQITGDDAGVAARFKIARTPAGDEALQLAADDALDGLSAVVQIEDYAQDPTEEGVWLVTKAILRRATLTSDPAFADARVTQVAASATKGDPMSGTPTPPTPPTPPTTPTAPTVPAPAAPGAEGQGEQFTRLADAITTFAAAVEALNGQIPPEQRPGVRPPVQVREPLVYQLNGLGHSFVRDAWDVRHAAYGSKIAEEAFARLRKYGEQTEALNQATLQRFQSGGDTTTQAEIIPPGYRPDLYVGQIPQGRPLFDSIGTKVVLANATSFKIPVWVGATGMSGTNTEGTGPSSGTITAHTYHTVEPTAQSGEFVLTRELMDSSNPIIDVIALNAMREEYSQDTEGLIATHLEDITNDGSPVPGTSDQSTEGCYVYAVTGTGNDLALGGIRFAEAEYPGHRFLTPDRMLASPTGYAALAQAIDDNGRPLFPFAGPVNVLGTVGRAAQTLGIDGLACPNAWSMTSTYDDVLLFNSVDILVGESPMLTFRFEEKGGPENIFLNIWAYFCIHYLRGSGIHAINYTAA